MTKKLKDIINSLIQKLGNKIFKQSNNVETLKEFIESNNTNNF